MELRPIASGTVSLGLVVIPVKLFSTGESAKVIRLHHVHKSCGSRVKYRYYCPSDDQLVERDELGKGYEVSKGRFVLFSDEELKSTQEESTEVIEISEFVPLEQVDPLYFEKAYYLGPDKGGTRPYHLLAQAMERTGRVALARYAARGKSYLVLLRPVDGALVMHQMRYADDLRAIADVPIESTHELQEAELDLAMQLIEARSSDRFRPEEYEDGPRARMWELIESKIQSDQIVGTAEEVPQAKIVDLMDALKASLEPAPEPEQPAAAAGGAKA